ncbi:MAG: hypothetical protein U0892_23025 [Pirellulales bacterium]
MSPTRTFYALVLLPALLLGSGCSLLPDVKHKPQYYNPFPQIQTVAVLPFVNQSEEPTLSGERVSLAYIDELQSIPGFEVLPLGAVKAKLQEYRGPLASGTDFQTFARELGVDVVVVGSVTDFTSYYPPRMTLKVNWYAANPAFHPIQPGYGLPWGTRDEKKIPRWIHHESQRALAREQLKTQTPDPNRPPEAAPVVIPPPKPVKPQPDPVIPLMPEDIEEERVKSAAAEMESANRRDRSVIPAGAVGTGVAEEAVDEGSENVPAGILIRDANPDSVEDAGQGMLPPDWPDPRGFQPDPPQPVRPEAVLQGEPIISHMRNYNGHDEDFTQRLEEYFYFRDDARFGGWQGYLRRSEDFIRVCCHFHVVDTLAARGGQDESRLILRWPLERFRR